MSNETGSITDRHAKFGAPLAAQPQLVLLLERARPLAGGARHSLANIDEVTIGRGGARVSSRIVNAQARTLALAVPDPKMSRLHARIERRDSGWTLIDCGSRNGSRIGDAQVTTAALNHGDVLELAGTFFRFHASMPTPPATAGDVDCADFTGVVASFGTLLPELATRLSELARVARSDLAILLLGERGTGKEVLARCVHDESGRTGPFVPVNCGALPATLLESLLFGHKKGSFSGATQDADGFVRSAHEGTLFLDEIGDLPKASQGALLRVLQERQVTPVGAARPLVADIRIVAATNRDLGALAESGEFREDLLARLAAYPFHLPALRNRIDDLGILIARLLARARARASLTGPVTIGAPAFRSMLRHSWPNNVRELEHCLAVSQALTSDGRIDDVRIVGTRSPDTASDEAASAGRVARRASAPSLSDKDAALRDEVVTQLRAHGGNVTRVGETMGKSRTQIQRWLKRFALDPRDFQS